jgi:hypothetical protein
MESKIASLLERLANGGRVENATEEETLHVLGHHLNQPKPKYACPCCWLKRLFEVAPRAIAERTRIPV